MIYGLVLVSKGDGERYLDPVLDRASRWADRLFVSLDPDATAEADIADRWVDGLATTRMSMAENDGLAKSEAWLNMTHTLNPSPTDHVGVIKATEILQNPEAIRKAVKDYPEHSLSTTVSHLWDEHHIRVDGSWKPREEAFMVPWRRGASYPDFRLRAGRLPTYHYNVASLGVPVCDTLDYDMVTFEDKLRKWDWFNAVDAAGFYSPDHILSIKRTPSLRVWKDGGVLHVGETV